jgi:hypothetical protein
MTWAAAMAACGALAIPDVQASIDCTVDRKDYRTICANPDLKSADERREAEVARIMAALPNEEREAFSLFEDRWGTRGVFLVRGSLGTEPEQRVLDSHQSSL